VYLFVLSEDKNDSRKRSLLKKLLLEQTDIVISAQVLNETANVLLSKYTHDEETVKTYIEQIVEQCEHIPLDEKISYEALHLKKRYKFSWFDSPIVAAALVADCSYLYSEDFQSGLMINNTLQIVNPFD